MTELSPLILYRFLDFFMKCISMAVTSHEMNVSVLPVIEVLIVINLLMDYKQLMERVYSSGNQLDACYCLCILCTDIIAHNPYM